MNEPHLIDVVNDLESGLRGWIDSHCLDFFLRCNQDSVRENYHLNWMLENCSHKWHENCDCYDKVPVLTDADYDAMIADEYEQFAMEFGIHDIMEDFTDALECLQKGGNDALASFCWAIHLNHVHGSIADYCFYIDRDMINEISQHGIAHVFGQSQIDEFLR